jgi:Ca-activated chloride channel homolog
MRQLLRQALQQVLRNVLRHGLLAASFALAALPASAQVKLSAAASDTMLVLDASGSMWGVVEGQTKIAAARQAVGAILGRWKPGDRLGLMAYGHRSKGDCRDIEVLAPVGVVDRDRILATVAALNPKGKTPLAESLRQAAAQLKSTEAKATVILVSDGIETCGADPCAVAAELKRAGVGFTAHVIGFDVADPLAKAQLQCIARNTGGVYLDARNAGELETALGKTVAATQGQRVASEAPARPPADDPLKGKNWRAVARLAEGLDPIADRTIAWTLYKPDGMGGKGEHVQTEYAARLAATAPPGHYLMEIEYGETSRLVPVTIEAGEATTYEVVLDAGYVTSEGAIAGSGAKADDWAFEVRSADGESIATAYERVPRFVLPAGNYVVELRKGQASVSKPFSLAAGDSINLALTLDAGQLLVEARYSPQGPKVETGLSVEVRKPAAAAEQGEWVATLYDPLSRIDLPAGAYDVLVGVGQATKTARVDITSGAPTRLTVDLEAGVAGISAPGAEVIEIVSPTQDINGQRASIHTGYGATLDMAFPAGNYLARATRAGETREQAFTVKAGERTEVVVGR